MCKVNMCGRYFLSLTPEKLKEIFGFGNIVEFPTNKDACPTQFLPIIVRSGNHQSRIGLGRWGLLPSHASHDDIALCAKLKNARSETILEKKSFSDLWQRGRRCIIPASGFYEWPEDKIKGHPGFAVSKGEVMAFAGIWNKSEDLVTFTILTRGASEELSTIHSRMPVMFGPEHADEFLSVDAGQAYAMMQRDYIHSGFKIETRERPISKSETPLLV